MEMKDAIVARRSVRTYTGEPLRESVYDGLTAFIAALKPLHDDIPVDIELCDREDFDKDFARSYLCRAHNFVVLRSATNARGYLQNVGFIGEQLILWLTHVGLGTCWCGLVKPNRPPARGELPYVITIQFGRPDNAPFRRLPEEAPRKKLHEVVLNKISCPEFLPLLDAGRLAPSALNLQPVRYYSDQDALYICRTSPPFSNQALDKMQQIDVGAAMANMFVQSGGGCTFARQEHPPELPQGCLYEYTVKI